MQLSLSMGGAGSGKVASTPSGMNCDSSCQSAFSAGTAVVLSALASPSSVFMGWSGACSGIGQCTVNMSRPQTVQATFGMTLQAVQHIIFMTQENRSFDQMLGHLAEYWADKGFTPVSFDGTPADASNPTVDGSGVVTPLHMVSMCVENTTPFWDQSHLDYNRYDPESTTAAMNGFVYTAGTHALNLGLQDTQGLRAMGYYDGSDLPFYYSLASQFATSDRWFSPVLTRSEANHMYLLAGTSAGHVYPLSPGSPVLPLKTIFQLLDEHNISWKIYYTDANADGSPDTALQNFSYYSAHPENIVPVTPNYFDDVANGTLPLVAMIEAGHNTGLDEHPGEDDAHPGGSVQYGAHYVSTLVNALLHSPSWNDSVFILTYDEAGGFYDHVPPAPAVYPDAGMPQPPSDLYPNEICAGNTTSPICTFQFTGFRIPLYVVSPFTKPHYVSHTVADYTAILKFIETRFGLPSLTKRDAAQMDMTEFFDFVHEPWKVPPTLPAQPRSGPCYQDHLP
jgi:phospholipase C